MRDPTIRMQILLLVAIAGLSGVAGRSLSAAEIPDGEVVKDGVGRKVHDYLEGLSGVGFSGGIILAMEGEVVLSHGYGMADRSGGRRFTPDTVFSIGSIVKPLTAACVMKLVEQGLVEVDDELSEFFEDLAEDKAAITIHELLTHSSGLPGAFGYDYVAYSRDDLVQSLRDCELLFVPGTRYEYSNPGFSLLAAVVELVSGQDYDSFLRENVLDPSGMSRSGYLLDRYREDELAHGYLDEEDWGTLKEKYWTDLGPSWHLMGNGAVQSNLKDMYRFHLAMSDETIVSEASKEEMFTPWVDEGGGVSHYGYGWVVEKTERGTPFYWHNGGNPYFSNDLRRYVEEDVAWYITSNNGALPASEVTFTVADIVFGREVASPPRVVDVDPAALALFAGAYELDGGDRVHVTTAGKRLVLRGVGQRAFGHVFGVPDEGGVEGEGEGATERWALTEKIASAFDAACKGDEERAAAGMGRSVAWVQDAMTPLLDELAANRGVVRGVSPIATIPAGRIDRELPPEMDATLVRIDFERGSRLVVTITFKGQFRGLDLIDVTEEVAFFPVGERDFAAFGTSPPIHTRVRFDAASGDLVFEGDGGSVHARRARGK